MASKVYRDILLKDRDRELLSFVEEQGFACFGQLNKRFFNSKSYCSERLQKLQAFNYLEKKKVYDFFVNPNTKKVSGGYWPHLNNLNINPNAMVYYINRGYSKGFGYSKGLFKPSMVLHQLILNDIRMILEKIIRHKWIHNDPYLKVLSFAEFGRTIDTIPDLSFEYDRTRVAVEVERTPKGRVRYFRRFNHFKDSKYSHILYYYTDNCQLMQLLERAGRSKKFAFASYSEPNKLLNPALGTLTIEEFVFS